MHTVEPKVFLIGETRVVEEGLSAYLDHIGAADWTTDAPTDAERLSEVFSRTCYRSWKPGLNPNVTKVREGNAPHLGNVIGQKHGSVFEHAVVNFVFADVSRVFTHELVRHRAGVAISQESLRFVRLEDLGQWLPAVIREDEKAIAIFVRTFADLERTQRELAKHFRLDDDGVHFARKKEVTSAMRRIAPIGLATTIGWSANFRTLRWLIDLRTSPGAEEEIRLVFGKVAELCIARYPNVFGDFTSEVVNGLPMYTPKYSKI